MARYDAVVLGAGDAGLEVASSVASSGGRVAIAYRDPYLGTCLNTGCNPSKFFIERARIAHQACRPDTGIDFSEPEIDLARMVDEKNGFISDAREEAFGSAMESDAIDLFRGTAEFVGRDSLRVNDQLLNSDRIFIATGARPMIPDIPGIDDDRVLTNESLMELRELPKSLAVLGGGYIACELGQAYSRFGTAVTIIQRAGHLLPREEPEISQAIEDAFEEEGIEVCTRHELIEITPIPGGLRLDGMSKDRRTFDLEVSHLLVAAGRTPNTDSLRLECAGVETDDTGFVKVDDTMETSNPGIWAVGDVNGQQPFTRIGQLEGQIAYANAFEEERVEIQRSTLPHAAFTDPEVGSVGMTEAQAKEAGLDVKASTFPVKQVPRARLSGETAGAIKVVVDKKSGKLLGCHVAARNGAELVYDAALLMRLNGTVDDLGHAVGTFPTMQEGIEGAFRAIAHSLHH